ncbi:hypothetical protein [Flavobacterium enshiense]|uniref:hypothetical protein n=1 Tax=Flavobacterium enshiense TaxID=1341165 RepID=UPI00040EAAB3|nr:hypothetical protein [Flavobacterium enshiense]
MYFNSKFWLKISLINLLIVASVGLLMRYKIGFEFPHFDQKSLQHSHSHFAFAGWISHTLTVLMIAFLEKRTRNTDKETLSFSKYNKIIISNLFCSYGMLISFIYQGYGPISIFFSTATILIFYIFSYHFIKDLRQINPDNLSIKWFRAAIFFNIISSLGTFALAYMMMTKSIQQDMYLASIYYYLHFQYNGWFFFACMGLFYDFLDIKKENHTFFKTTFYLLFVACIPAYFLSTLWMKLPLGVYIITALSALIQVYAWFRFLSILVKTKLHILKNNLSVFRWIILFIGFATSLKLLLQLGSTIPSVSKLAFGFRPIVIAYLHLVLLAIISLFLLFYIFSNQFLAVNKKIIQGLIIFSTGVLLNETVLAIQGIASFSYTLIPGINETLFGVSIIMVFGIIFITANSLQKVKSESVL